MNLQVLDFLVTVFGLMLLLVLWNFCWKPYTVSRLRQDLFHVRARLFDSVADKETTLTFQSPAYQHARRSINSLIRYAHEISVPTTLVGFLMVPEGPRKYREQETLLLATLSDDAKELLRRIDKQESQALMRFLLTSSMSIWVLMALVFVVAILRIGVALCKGGVLMFRSVFKQILLYPAIESIEFESTHKYRFGC